jgi:DNA-binding response OmpR family regulator
MSSHEVMVVSHDLATQQGLASVLGQCGCFPIIATSMEEALTILDRHPVALVFYSDEPPDEGIESFIRYASCPPDATSVVVVSHLDDWKRYIHFLRLGAFDYVLYPAYGDEIERVARAVLHHGEVFKVKAGAPA